MSTVVGNFTFQKGHVLDFHVNVNHKLCTTQLIIGRGAGVARGYALRPTLLSGGVVR